VSHVHRLRPSKQHADEVIGAWENLEIATGVVIPGDQILPACERLMAAESQFFERQCDMTERLSAIALYTNG
jgi:hypothetical protein